jgi:N-acetylglutamate synthase-like GNAT family acetyltransferase
MQSRELTQCADFRLSGASNAEGARMPVLLRRATEADAKHVESLLAELGYPKEADVRHRVRNSLRSDTSCFLLAQSASEVIGLVSAELVPYFPNGSTICRITGLVVSTQHRGRGVGEKLLAGAADFAREHHCSGIEITSAEHRLDAHRFYQRLGFSRTSFRFFQAL